MTIPITDALCEALRSRAEGKAEEARQQRLAKLEGEARVLRGRCRPDKLPALERRLQDGIDEVNSPESKQRLVAAKMQLYTGRIQHLPMPQIPEPPPIHVRSERDIIGDLEAASPISDVFVVGFFFGNNDEVQARNRKRIEEGKRISQRERAEAKAKMEAAGQEHARRMAEAIGEAINEALGDD